MHKQFHLVILAAGSATRMLPIHQNCYPKILCNLGQETQIGKTIDAYPIADKITIFVDTELQKFQVEEMLAALDKSHVDVKFINSGEKKSNFRSVKLAIEQLSEDDCKNVIMSWSDICPKYKITKGEISSFRENTIVLDVEPRHRVKAEFGRISSGHKDGNVVGLYYFKDLKIFDNYSEDDAEDITDIFIEDQRLHKNEFNFNYISADFIDVGEVSKYEKYLESVDIKQRFFNDIEAKGKRIIKKALTAYGSKVLENEAEFYMHIAGSPAEKVFPEILHFTPSKIEMEKIDGQTVNEHINDFRDDEIKLGIAKDCYKMFTELVSNLHSSNLEADIPCSVKEYATVPFERIHKIENILPKIENVNGFKVNVEEVNLIISKLAPRITERFTLIHGDPNTSNVMIERGRKLRLIDPRGQFGGNKYYGDPLYDHAKFLYGLSGYDDFNLTKDVRFDWSDNEIYFEDEYGIDLDKLTDNTKIKYLVALIWYKLPYYTINNINKAIVSYAKGLQMVTQYGSQLIDELDLDNK